MEWFVARISLLNTILKMIDPLLLFHSFHEVSPLCKSFAIIISGQLLVKICALEMASKILIIALILIFFAMKVRAGPLAYAACQAACAAGAAAMAGATAFAGTPAAVAGYAACQAGCAALLVAPTP
uniref:Uncharacterized protein n=1 Tax=Panagrolaimus sp. ES5 TaxID=591445 RepID=A0AC34GBR1_9BILA